MNLGAHVSRTQSNSFEFSPKLCCFIHYPRNDIPIREIWGRKIIKSLEQGDRRKYHMTILFRGYSYPKSNLNHEQKENVNGRARLSENFKTDKPINGEWEIQ